MSDAKPQPGQIIWTDLTVADAGQVRDFYKAVVGWEPADHPMETHTDYDMRLPGTEKVVAGVCHALGPNQDIPPQWMIYIAVADLDASLAACKQQGGAVIKETRSEGAPPFAIIRDPAGAVAALYQVG